MSCISLAYSQKFTGIDEPTAPGYYWVNYKPFPHTKTVITEIVRLEWLRDVIDGPLGLYASYAAGGPAWVKEFSQYEPALWGPAIPCPWRTP